MQLFVQALTIMTLGMALVFLFLFIVILCMNATAHLVRRYLPEKPEAGDDGAEAEGRARLAAAVAVAIGGEKA